MAHSHTHHLFLVFKDKITYMSAIVCVCLVTQSCPTLCDPLDCSLPGSSVHGTSQVRILEWVPFYYLRIYTSSVLSTLLDKLVLLRGLCSAVLWPFSGPFGHMRCAVLLVDA